MSGSIIVIDGVPVGYVISADTDQAILKVRRFDYLRSKRPDDFIGGRNDEENKINKRPAAAINRDAYSIIDLPDELVSAIKEARRNRATINKIVVEAENIKQLAIESANEADRLPSQTRRNRLIRSSTRSGSYYRGQASGTDEGGWKADGYGISKRGDGINNGDEYYCLFGKSSSCQGIGVVKYSINSGNHNNLDSYYGTLKDGNRDGLGLTKLNCDMLEKGSAYEFFQNHNYEKIEKIYFGEINYCDGKKYEGGLTGNGRINGLGILWNKNGTINNYGIYKDGYIIESYKYSWQETGEIDKTEDGIAIRRAILKLSGNKRIKKISSFCRKDNYFACDLIGFFYQDSEDVDEHKKAINPMKKACDGGFRFACYRLGKAYENAKGIETDYSQALSYYQKSCEDDAMEGCWAASQIILKGYVPNIGGDAHIEYLNKACKLGASNACSD